MLKKIFAIAIAINLMAASFPPMTVNAEANNYSCNLDGLWKNEVYEKEDPVNRAIGADFNMHFSDFIKVGSEIWSYYIDTDSYGNMGIGLAKSQNGIDFTDYGVVLSSTPGAWDNIMSSFPGIYYDNGIFYLVYEGSGTNCNGDIGLATSSDGMHFTKQGKILVHENAGWESSNIGTPDLYKIGDVWYLTYHGFNANVCQVGVASGPDIYSLTKYAQNPVIPAGSSNEADSGTIGRRDITYYNGYYYMVYEISTQQPYSQAKWSHTFARSTDMFNWTCLPQGNIFSQTDSGMGNDGPSFLNIEGVMWIYYRVGGNYSRRARLANELNGGVTESAEAESLSHQPGRVDGNGWSANTTADSPGYMVFGLYKTDIPQGRVTGIFKTSIDNNTANDARVLTLEAVDLTLNAVVATRDITRKMFYSTYHYEFFSLPFNNIYTGHNIEFRAYWHAQAYVNIDKILLNYDYTQPQPTDNIKYYEAENTPGIPASRDVRSDRIVCDIDRHEKNFPLFTTGQTLETGHYKVLVFANLLSEPLHPENSILGFDVYGNEGSGLVVKYNSSIMRSQFAERNKFQPVIIEFTVAAAMTDAQLRLYFNKNASIEIDRFILLKNNLFYVNIESENLGTLLAASCRKTNEGILAPKGEMGQKQVTYGWWGTIPAGAKKVVLHMKLIEGTGIATNMVTAFQFISSTGTPPPTAWINEGMFPVVNKYYAIEIPFTLTADMTNAEPYLWAALNSPQNTSFMIDRIEITEASVDTRILESNISTYEAEICAGLSNTRSITPDGQGIVCKPAVNDPGFFAYGSNLKFSPGTYKLSAVMKINERTAIPGDRLASFDTFYNVDGVGEVANVYAVRDVSFPFLDTWTTLDFYFKTSIDLASVQIRMQNHDLVEFQLDKFVIEKLEDTDTLVFETKNIAGSLTGKFTGEGLECVTGRDSLNWATFGTEFSLDAGKYNVLAYVKQMQSSPGFNDPVFKFRLSYNKGGTGYSSYDTTFTQSQFPSSPGEYKAFSIPIEVLPGERFTTTQLLAGFEGNTDIVIDRFEILPAIEFGTFHTSPDYTITNIIPGTSVAALRGSITPVAAASWCSKSDEMSIGTGTSLNVEMNNYSDIYTTIVFGDITGDGAIAIDDLSSIKRHILRIDSLNGVFMKAADVNKNGFVTISDLLSVKKTILGTGTIRQNLLLGEEGGSMLSTIVSRRVTTSDGNNYLEIEGKPILYNSVELRTDLQHLDMGAPLEDEEILFKKARDLNYKIVSPVLTWRDVEEAAGQRNYAVIDKYIDWAKKYDLYLDLVWFGVNVDSGVWTTLAPYDLWNNHETYPHILNSDGTWKMLAQGGLGFLYVMDMSSNSIKNREMSVFADLWNHISTYDLTRRVVAVQLENETGMLYQFPDEVIVPYIKSLNDIVKNSKHSVFTRLNSPKTSLIGQYLSIGIDSCGYDPYTNKITDPATPERGLDYWQNLYNVDGNWYGVHENGANGNDIFLPQKPDSAITNVTSLMMYTFSNGNGYVTYDLANDQQNVTGHFWNTAVYTMGPNGSFNLIDNNNSTSYSSADMTTDFLRNNPQSVILGFPGINNANSNLQVGYQTIDSVTLRTSFGKSQGPKSWTVYTSNDKFNWTQRAEINNVWWSFNDSTVESRTVSFSDVPAVYVKVTIRDANLAGGYFSISEVAASLNGNYCPFTSFGATSIKQTFDYRGSTQSIKEFNDMVNNKDTNGFDLARLCPSIKASFYNVESSYPEESYESTKITDGIRITYNTKTSGLAWTGVDKNEKDILFMSTKAGVFKIPSTIAVTSLQKGRYDSNHFWIKEADLNVSKDDLGTTQSFDIGAGDVIRLQIGNMSTN